VLLIIKQRFIFNFYILIYSICILFTLRVFTGTSGYLCLYAGRSIAAGFYPGEESPDNAGQHTT